MQKKELKRLQILYYIFFAFVVLSVCFAFASVLSSNHQEKNIAEQLKEKVSKTEYSFYIASFLKKEKKNSQFDIPIYSSPDENLVVSGRVNTFDVLVQGSELDLGKSKYLITGFILAVITILGLLAILVLLGILFYSLRKSIKNGRIFSKKDIKYIRVIACFLIGISIVSSLSLFFEHLEIAHFLSGTEWAPIVEIPIPFFEITFGIVILFISEFFTVGYRLQEDQELTI